MKKTVVMLIVAGAFAAGGAFAAEEKSNTDLESRLEAARQRLEQAAREVAELSAEVGKPVMDRFMMLGEGRRAIIGVQLDPASGKDGAKVKDVSPGGPAAEAGIKPQDVIVMVNGTEVKGDSVREVTSIMRKVEPESKVKVRVLRDGKPRDFTVVARPAVGMFTRAVPAPPPPPGFPGHDMAFEFRDSPLGGFFGRFYGEFSDMELANLTPQLGRYFGTNEGVLVVRKPEGDDSLKLEDGDVILSIDGRKPTGGSHATRILNSYQPGEKITLRVMRQKKLINLDVTMPERRGHPEVKILRAGEEPT